MENPGAWGEAEKTVHAALVEHSKRNESGLVCGPSLEMIICNALRAKGLLSE